MATYPLPDRPDVRRPTTFGQPLGAPVPPGPSPGAAPPPTGPSPMPPEQPGMPPVMPPGAPMGGPMGAAMPDPRELQRLAIIEALGGEQVVPDSAELAPDGPSTQPRAFVTHESNKRGFRY